MGRLGLDNHQCQLFHKSYSLPYLLFFLHSVIFDYFMSNLFSVMMYELPLSLSTLNKLVTTSCCPRVGKSLIQHNLAKS